MLTSRSPYGDYIDNTKEARSARFKKSARRNGVSFWAHRALSGADRECDRN